MSNTARILLTIVGGAILLLLLSATLMGDDMIGGMGSMISSGRMGGGIFGMLLFWGLIIAWIIALIIPMSDKYSDANPYGWRGKKAVAATGQTIARSGALRS